MTKNDTQSICPVTLLKLLLEKRNKDITSERHFLIPNTFSKNTNSKGWYKNVPLGINTISTWNKNSATKIGLDITIIIQTMPV